MLRFGRKSKVATESEFEIVRSSDQPEVINEAPGPEVKRSRTVEQTSPQIQVTQDPLPQPAWKDDDDVINQDYRPIPLLDVRKKKDKEKIEASSDDNDSDSEYAYHCMTKILRDDKSVYLPETKELRIQRLFDANRERISKGGLSSVHFNPAFQMMLTASEDTTLAVFKVDGKENALLRDRVFEKFPLSSAKFTAHGDRILLTGNRNSFRLYDLQTGTETRASPFIGSTPEEVLSNCQLSTGKPNITALQNGANKVYLADLRSLERTATMQTRCSVRSCCFVQDGSFLNTMDASGTVYVFDLRMRKPLMVHQWADEASSGGRVIVTSSDGQWIACGSDSGFVNIYPLTKTIQSPNPHPDKSIANLRSCADLAAFHPGNEMLCIGSSSQVAAVRLYHLRSRQVFDNFPVRVGHLGSACSVAFSPGGRYLCIGQKNGRAALYSILHYPDY